MAYGVLGVGAIGAAIVTGLCETVADPPRVLLSPRNAEIAAGLAQRFATVDVAPDNQAVVDGARVVIVCVRPQVAQPVLGELRFPADGVVISAMAGVSVTALKRLVAPATDVARVIPLPSVARRGRPHAGPSAQRGGQRAIRSPWRDGRACRRQGVRSFVCLDRDDRRALRLSERHRRVA
jgi:NADP oxidoreductase coenzyme F420-dependent